MNSKNIRISTLFIMIFHFTPVFSQQQGYEKYVFVYKKVQDHEIRANIFIPNIKQNHPVLVYFHGGGFIFGNRDIGLEDVLRDKLLAHHYEAIIVISTPTDFSNANMEEKDESILEQPGPYDMVSDNIVSYGDYDARLELWRFLARHKLVLSEVFGFDESQDTTV